MIKDIYMMMEEQVMLMVIKIYNPKSESSAETNTEVKK